MKFESFLQLFLQWFFYVFEIHFYDFLAVADRFSDLKMIDIEKIGKGKGYPLLHAFNNHPWILHLVEKLFNHDFYLIGIFIAAEPDWPKCLIDSFFTDFIVVIEHEFKPYFMLFLLGWLFVAHINYTWWI